MPIPLGSPLPPAPPPGRRRSFVKRMFRGAGWLSAGPMDWAGTGRVRRGWSLIGDLATILRAGPGRDQRFKTEDCGVFDARATAFSYGLSVPQLEQRLLARRRQTARIAYTTFALGWLFLVGWLLRALGSPLTTTRVMSALYFLPFCGLFFLIAFHNALLNFQIRSGRLASWHEYLATSERFWPC